MCGEQPDTHRVFVAECALRITVHLGYLDIGEAREVLFGQIFPCWSEILTVATPAGDSGRMTNF